MAKGAKIKKINPALIRRIKNLPVFLNDHVKAYYKKDAQEVVKTFEKGIQENSLGLDKLQPETIREKQRKGYTNPRSPLYGRGGNRSYSKMLRVMVYTKSIRIAVSKAMHWSGIPLNKLFMIHEFGATIRKKTKNGTITIRIPARPAFLMAWLKVMKKIKKDGHRELKKAVNEYIKTGKESRA